MPWQWLFFTASTEEGGAPCDVSLSRNNLKAAVYADTVGRFYAGAVSGAIGFNGRALPVGMADAGR